MTYAAAIESRCRLTEDGTLVDNDDLRRMLGVVRAVEEAGRTRSACHGLPTRVPFVESARDRWLALHNSDLSAQRHLDAASLAIAANDMHALDLALAEPSRQEVG